MEEVIVPMSYEMRNTSLWESDDFFDGREHCWILELVYFISIDPS